MAGPVRMVVGELTSGARLAPWRSATCATGSRCSSARASSSASRAEVDPDLEITEIVDRTVKAGGPALLFENAEGRERIRC